MGVFDSDNTRVVKEGTAGYFNSYARHPLNAPMYEIEQNYLDGLITPRRYVNEFNKWG